MKTIIPFIIIALISFVGCTNQEDDFVTDCTNSESINDSIYMYNLFLETNINDITRVTEDGLWEDNDVIYLLFTLAQNFRMAYATYNKSNNSWMLFSSFDLAQDTDGNLSIYYCKGKNPQRSSPFESVYYDYISAIYYGVGKYTYDKYNNIFVNASISPEERRIRFKGQPGTTLIIYNNINYYNSIWINEYNVNPSPSQDLNDYLTLNVNENGYTDYVVCAFSLITFLRFKFIAISFPQTGVTYYKPWPDDFLNIGESGCYTIPTDTDLHGWSLSNSETYSYDGHECIDLGLKSGTLWATCNIGANSITEIGNYYSYGEVHPKSSYSESNYTYYDGDLDDEHDAAYVNWGSSWRMPTWSEQEEFLDYTCSATISINGTKGIMFIGPNGNTVFFPLSGIYHDDKKDNTNCFWSSTSKNYTNAYSMNIDGYGNKDNLKYYGIPIRPVKSSNYH